MKPLNVNQLIDYLKQEQEKGHGDYTVFVTDDEEANGYHGLWYLGETAKQIETRGYLKDVEKSNHDIETLDDRMKAIYIG